MKRFAVGAGGTYVILINMAGKTVQAQADVAFRRLGEECLLVPIRRSPTEKLSVFTLNPVGVLLWQHLQQPRSLDELTEAVVAVFDVGRDNAERDVSTFVAALETHHLLRGADTANLR